MSKTGDNPWSYFQKPVPYQFLFFQGLSHPLREGWFVNTSTIRCATLFFSHWIVIGFQHWSKKSKEGAQRCHAGPKSHAHFGCWLPLMNSALFLSYGRPSCRFKKKKGRSILKSQIKKIRKFQLVRIRSWFIYFFIFKVIIPLYQNISFSYSQIWSNPNSSTSRKAEIDVSNWNTHCSSG